jgi:DNA-directed RNA polymerase subunit RPC12/RpoP
MSEGARDLLVRGIAAAKAKEREEARFFLEWVLRSDADREQTIDAWWWLSEISDKPAEKREYLENVLALEPTHPEARRGLAILDGRLDPAEIIDPNRPSPATTASPQPASAKRFICQHCGGKLAFSPDDQQLTCTYCKRRISLCQAIEDGAMVQEQDFVVALATAKGHAHPIATQSFSCQACGASFMLGPGVLSLTCPYCGSAYVVMAAESRELIPPEGVIPFATVRDQAVQAFDAWLREKGWRKEAHTNLPAGLYVPAWTFDVGGEIQWRGMALEQQYAGMTWMSRNGAYPIFYNDVLVPASHTLPADQVQEVYSFQLDRLAAYDPAYLADWPAEIYQISPADASLVARRQAWEQARHMATTRASVEIGYVKDLTFSSAGMVIESFKLILLPLWIAHYRIQERDYTAVINGQTGTVRTGSSHNGLLDWLGQLF